MDISILGAGMMGQAIAFDLNNYSNFKKITIVDNNNDALEFAKKFLSKKKIEYKKINVKDQDKIIDHFKSTDVVISAIPYYFNFDLSKIAIKTKTHFLDLGGNNDIVKSQRNLFSEAKKSNVTIIPDCGLAPGLTSVIVKDVFNHIDFAEIIKIRVGGLPIDPLPPLNYQIVFSPYGLINEYFEDALVVSNGKIITKKSMTEVENISFPKPFGDMEAFLTSGGCSTIPYTFEDKIKDLDYKTIRYPGHCEKFKLLLDLGLAENKDIVFDGKNINLRDFFANFLIKVLPNNQKDVVLLKVIGKSGMDGKKICFEYVMVDFYDEKNDITSMMRTTGYPVSIISQMIEDGTIIKRGVFCSEEIVPCQIFFQQLEKRNIKIKKDFKECV